MSASDVMPSPILRKAPDSPTMKEYINDFGDDVFFGDHTSDLLLRPHPPFQCDPLQADSDDSPSSHSDSLAEDMELFGLDIHGHRSSLDTCPSDSGRDLHSAGNIHSAKPEPATPILSIAPAIISQANQTYSPPAPNYELRLHGIPDKSRVETQIKLGLTLLEHLPDGTTRSAGDRFQYIKLPAWGMAKEKLKLKNRRDTPETIDPRKIVFLDARVVKSTEPLEDVKICSGCIIRERKRAQRKKESAKQKDKTRPPDASAVPPQEIPLADEERKILVFNCPELLEMDKGQVYVPTRVTCYCRHHKEKVGFRLIVTLCDAAGTTLATTTSELVLITDDHKTLIKPTPNEGAGGSKILEGSVPASVQTSPNPSKVAQHSTSRRSSISSAATSRKRKAEPVNIAPAIAPKIQKVPSSLSMTRLTKGEIQASTRQEPMPPAAMSASTSRAVSPSTARSLHRSQSQDSLMQFMNLHEDRAFPDTSAHLTSPSRSLQWEASTEDAFDRGHSLSPRTRTIEYLMEGAARQAGVLPQQFSGNASAQVLPITEAPTINRLIPAEGPLQGGVEITVLGSGFYPGLTCMFGEVAAVPTHCWSPTTMVCVLPPAATAGVVSVTFREHPYNAFIPTSFPGKPFSYIDDTDRALMELALQVIGLKSTGKLETARDVALRICQNSMPSESASQHIANLPIQQLRAALSIDADQDIQMEDLLIKCLGLLNLIPTMRPARYSYRSPAGHTMLHLATMNGYLRLAKELLARGANVNLRDRLGYTPLHFAALYDRYDIAAEMLLVRGTNVSLSTSDGLTAYDLAAMTDDADLIALCDPWSWTQNLTRSTRSNSVVSQDDVSDAISQSTSTALSRRSSAAESDTGRGRTVRAKGVATQPSSRASSPGVRPNLRRRSSISQLDPGILAASIEDLKQFAKGSSQIDDAAHLPANAASPDPHTLAQQFAQIQQSWTAFLTATSPAWFQKVASGSSLPERFKSNAQLQQFTSMPPLMAFQAMLPAMPTLPLRGTSKETDTPDATWLSSLVSSLGAPPTYAEATAAIPLLGAMTGRSTQAELVSEEGVSEAASSSAVEPSSSASRRSWWPARSTALRSQTRIADMTPEQQRAQAKRFQKPCDRMMLMFWLPCLTFFILLSVFKITFGKLLAWVH